MTKVSRVLCSLPSTAKWLDLLTNRSTFSFYSVFILSFIARFTLLFPLDSVEYQGVNIARAKVYPLFVEADDWTTAGVTFTKEEYEDSSNFCQRLIYRRLCREGKLRE